MADRDIVSAGGGSSGAVGPLGGESIHAGMNLMAFVAAVEAASGQDRGEDARGSGRFSVDDVVPSQLPTAAFQLYYDADSEGYRMRDPLVVGPDGSEIACGNPGGFREGVTYYCIVECKDGAFTAKVSANAGGFDDESDAVWVTKLFTVPYDTGDEEGDGAPLDTQFHTGAIVVSRPPPVPDDCSIEKIPDAAPGTTPTGDEGKLQIFDFDSNESDSPEGFVERLKADTETGKIKLESGTNIMLLARRDGKMVYIPLTAGGTDPEDEKPYDPESPDPCAHPGDSAPGAETHGGGGGGGGGVPVGGGVPAGGDIHTGDDNCNCGRV